MKGIAAFKEQQGPRRKRQPDEIRMGPGKRLLQAIEVVAGRPTQPPHVLEGTARLGRLQQDGGDEMRFVEMPGLFVALAHHRVVHPRQAVIAPVKTRQAQHLGKEILHGRPVEERLQGRGLRDQVIADKGQRRARAKAPRVVGRQAFKIVGLVRGAAAELEVMQERTGSGRPCLRLGNQCWQDRRRQEPRQGERPILRQALATLGKERPSSRPVQCGQGVTLEIDHLHHDNLLPL